MQFAYSSFIYCQATYSSNYLHVFEFIIKEQGFLIKISLPIWYIDFVMTTFILNVHVCKLDFIIWQKNEGLLCYTSVKAMHLQQHELF